MTSPSPGHQAGAPLRRGERASEVVGDAPSPGHQAGAPLRQPDRGRRGRMGGSSPGHQAGAPLRHAEAEAEQWTGYLLPPAIRPGLHCGFSCFVAEPVANVVFPRPSGRGSIAASRSSPTAPSARSFPRPSGRGSIAARWRCGRGGCATWPSPGHQAGAPLRPKLGEKVRQLSGLFPRPSGRGSIAALPAGWRSWYIRRPSPGHQAGAPLRPLSPPRQWARSSSLPQPSGRGSIAACRRRTGAVS